MKLESFLFKVVSTARYIALLTRKGNISRKQEVLLFACEN